MKRITKRAFAFGALATAASLALAGCTTDPTVVGAPQFDESKTLHVLAGSEVKDMEPIFTQLTEETGVHLDFTYTGTLDGSADVASGRADGKYDATWFPSNRYLSVLPGAADKLATETKVMSSPVALGVKPAVAAKLGWDTTAPSWAQVLEAVKVGDFKYGMTAPFSSNSGFAALIGAATAFSGTGDALTLENISQVAPSLTDLSKGQGMTSGSSGWLAEKFQQVPDEVDGIFNYVNVLEETPVNNEELVVVIPSDGVITADYPFTLLSAAGDEKKALYTQVADYLQTAEVQKQIADTTHRNTSANPVNNATVFELPFPGSLDVVQELINTYLSSIKKPSQMFFTLDTSGSMEGDRLAALKESLGQLVTDDGGSSFVTFHARESATFVEFSDQVKSVESWKFTDDNSTAFGEINRYVDELAAGGGTAIYSSLEESYKQALKAKEAQPDAFTSVVLLSDGENTDGKNFADFQKWYDSKRSGDSGIQTVPAFVISFGDADQAELSALAELTGGKVFEANDGNLSTVFREIRGYQ
jgi:Ca-activated chloride channel family protein